MRKIMTSGKDDHEDLVIRRPVIPAAERMGDWWRRRWSIGLPKPLDRPITLPPPIWDFRIDTAMIISAWPTESGGVVETFARQENMVGDEMIYISIIAHWLCRGADLSEVSVAGVVGHPFLRMCPLDPAKIAEWEALGY